MTIYKSIVIEDDNTSRFLLCELLRESEKFEVIRDFVNPIDAFKFLSKMIIDVVFLDVEMSEMSGIDLAKLLPEGVKIIFTTSEQKYAFDAFGVNAFDFILKPVDITKLFLIADKLDNSLETNFIEKPIFLKTKDGFVKLNLDEVTYIQAFGDYIIFFTETNKFTVRQSLNNAIQMVKHLSFTQVHRSYLVNLNSVDSFNHDSLMIKSDKIPVSRGFKDSFQSQINKFF